MKTSFLSRTAFALALTAFAAAPAMAKDSGFFFGASLGQSKFHTENLVPDDPAIALASTDDKDTSIGVLTGYRINRYLGFEFGAHEFGDLKIDALVRSGGASELQNVTLSARGLSLSVVGSLPIGEKWDLYAKVGGLRGETKGEIVVRGVSASVIAFGEAKTLTTEMLYAAGVGYEFNDEFFVRLEWLRIPDMGDEDEGTGIEADISVIGLGVQYRF